MAQNLTAQKRMAGRVMKCGVSRVWLDPARIADIADAITAADIRRLEMQGAIKELPVKGNSKSRSREALKQKRKGGSNGRTLQKEKLDKDYPRAKGPA